MYNIHYYFCRYNYDKKMSELSSADDDHPLKPSGGGISNNGGGGSGGGMSFASLSVSLLFQFKIYTKVLFNF